MNIGILTQGHTIGDMAIVGALVQLLRKKNGAVNCSVIDGDLTAQEAIVLEKTLSVGSLGVRYLPSFCPSIYKGKVGFFSVNGFELIRGVGFFLRSLWVLFLVVLLKRGARKFLPSSCRPVFQSICDADMLILKAASSFSAYNVASRFGLMKALYFYRISLPVFIASLLKKEIICISAQIGPLTGSVDVFFTKHVLSKCRWVFVRDESSYHYAKKLNVVDDARILFCPDLAFWHDQEKRTVERAVTRILDKEGISADSLYPVRIGLTLRNGYSPEDNGNPKYLREHLRRTLFPCFQRLFHQIPFSLFIFIHSDPDYEFSRDLMLDIGVPSKFLIDGRYCYHYDDLRCFYQGLNCLIGMRTHSCICALSVGTPIVSMAYEDPKGIDLIDRAQPGGFAARTYQWSAETLFLTISKALREEILLRERNTLQAHQYRSQIEEVFERFVVRDGGGDKCVA